MTSTTPIGSWMTFSDGSLVQKLFAQSQIARQRHANPSDPAYFPDTFIQNISHTKKVRYSQQSNVVVAPKSQNIHTFDLATSHSLFNPKCSGLGKVSSKSINYLVSV